MGPYWQEEQLLYFSPRPYIARLAMTALPPIICYAFMGMKPLDPNMIVQFYARNIQLLCTQIIR